MNLLQFVVAQAANLDEVEQILNNINDHDLLWKERGDWFFFTHFVNSNLSPGFEYKTGQLAVKMGYREGENSVHAR